MKNCAHSIFSKSTQQQDVCNHIPKIKQEINVIYIFLQIALKLKQNISTE